MTYTLSQTVDQGSEALVKHGGRVGNCHMADEKGYITEQDH